MPEWVQPPPQVNAKCDVVMKLSVLGTRTDTHIRQNLYILALQAVMNSRSYIACHTLVASIVVSTDATVSVCSTVRHSVCSTAAFTETDSPAART